MLRSALKWATLRETYLSNIHKTATYKPICPPLQTNTYSHIYRESELDPVSAAALVSLVVAVTRYSGLHRVSTHLTPVIVTTSGRKTRRVLLLKKVKVNGEWEAVIET